MPKTSNALLTMPPAATKALQTLGENLAIARARRRESQRVWAKRLGVSIPTLIRMERGDPGVGAGIYVTALWLMGTVRGLPDLAAPAADHGALERDIRKALQMRAARSAASAKARPGRPFMNRRGKSLGVTRHELSHVLATHTNEFRNVGQARQVRAGLDQLRIWNNTPYVLKSADECLLRRISLAREVECNATRLTDTNNGVIATRPPSLSTRSFASALPSASLNFSTKSYSIAHSSSPSLLVAAFRLRIAQLSTTRFN